MEERYGAKYASQAYQLQQNSLIIAAMQMLPTSKWVTTAMTYNAMIQKLETLQATNRPEISTIAFIEGFGTDVVCNRTG